MARIRSNPSASANRRATIGALATLLCAVTLLALTLSGCGNGGRDPRPLAPPERAPAPWLASAPPTLRNALAQTTREPLRVRVRRAILGTSFAWLQVGDDDASEAWVVTLPLAATPLEPVILSDYVVVGGADAPTAAGEVERALFVSDIAGSDATLAPTGDDVVLDPLLPPVEVTGLQAVDVEPIGPRIAELHDRRAELAGSTVRLRAQVWRVIPRVAGLDWAIVRDGSAAGRRGTLLIGTRQAIEPGGVIEIQGVLTADRLLGGRVQSVVLEPARIVGADRPATTAPAAPPPSPRL